MDHQLASELFASHVRDRIIQNCAICGQWIADARQVKQHIRQSHKEVWNQYHADIDALCATFGRAITVPCGYCGTDKINSSNRPRHAKLCGVLFQTLLVLRIAQQEGHVGTGDGCLSPPPPQWGAGNAANGRRRQSQSQTDHDGRKTERSPHQVAEERRQGPGTRARTGTRASDTVAPRQTLGAFFRVEGGGGNGRRRNDDALACDGPVSHSTGGSAEPGSVGQGLLDTSEDTGSGVHARRNVQDKRNLERGQSLDATQGYVLVAGCLVQVLYDGTAVEASNGGEAGGTGGINLEGLDVPARRGTDVEIPGVGHREAAGCAPPIAGADCTHDNPTDGAILVGPRVRPDSTQVSRHEAVGRDLCGTISMLYARNQLEGRARTENASGALLPGPMRGHEADGNQLGTGEDQAQPAGTADQQAVAVIKGLQLVNNGNYCYQHVLLLSYMWTSCCAVGCVAGDSDGYNGRLQPVIDFLMRGPKRVLLSRCLMWQPLLQQWRQPQRQHDIGEFMTHVMQKASPDSMRGTWHAMTMAGEVRDVGTFLGPLVVHLTEPTATHVASLQALIDGWVDAGDGIQRLLFEAPPILCVQIARFHGRRHIRKSLQQVSLGNGEVRLQCRERPGHDSELCIYRVQALSVHIGHTPSTGHYRAVLLAERPVESVSSAGSSGSAIDSIGVYHSIYHGAHYTDDGASATPVLDGDVNAIMCNMYLIWCIKAV